MNRGELQIQDLRVFQLLTDAQQPVTTRQIADRFDIPIRTVQRIVQVLEDIRIPMRRDSAAMGGGIKILGDYKLKVSLPSNLVELAALLVARDSIRARAGETIIGEAFEQLVDRIMLQLKSPQRAACERFAKLYRTQPDDRPANANPIARMAHTAIDDHRVLAIEYVSPNEHRPKRRDIEPLGVWVGSKRTYIIGRDRQKQALRTFAIDRIRWASVSETRFAPGEFEPAKYFAHSIDAFVGDGPVDLEIALDAESVRRLGTKLPASSRLIRSPDGGGVLHWSVPLSDELVSWLFSVGPGASVRAPSAAVGFVRDRLQARLKVHAAPRRAKAPAKKRAKPRSLPGPLARRMLRKST